MAYNFYLRLRYIDGHHRGINVNVGVIMDNTSPGPRTCEVWMPPYQRPDHWPKDQYSVWRRCKNAAYNTRDGHRVCGHHLHCKNVPRWLPPEDVCERQLPS